tara:strand:+ start:213 stop:728 length:516 start_codon:yes stop_codon:yes gene_type:complete
MKHLTKEEVTKVISYNPETGEFMRLVGTGKGAKKGTITKGSIDKSNGYLCLSVCGVQFYSHRLAWFLTYGNWPTQTIDHINRDRADNRISNLRDVSYSDNNLNMGIRSSNTSDCQGVSWHGKGKKWLAQIKRYGKYYYLGLFESKEKAKELHDFVAEEIALGGYVALKGLK